MAPLASLDVLESGTTRESRLVRLVLSVRLVRSELRPRRSVRPVRPTPEAAAQMAFIALAAAMAGEGKRRRLYVSAWS